MSRNLNRNELIPRDTAAAATTGTAAGTRATAIPCCLICKQHGCATVTATTTINNCDNNIINIAVTTTVVTSNGNGTTPCPVDPTRWDRLQQGKVFQFELASISVH